MSNKSLSHNKNSKHTSTKCPYDKIRISYCGSFQNDLPECSLENEYVLLKKGGLFVYRKYHWYNVDTDERYYFYDAVSRKLLHVNSRAKKITYARVEGKILSCNGRKLYEIRDSKWSKIATLVDTESITRMTFINDEQELKFTLDGKFYNIHEDSEFDTSKIEISDTTIKVDTSDIEKGDTKVLIYRLRIPKCKGTGIIVNQIIIRVGEIATTSSLDKCGPHFPIEEVSQGDFVVLQNEGSQEPRLRKISPTGTFITKTTIASNPTIKYYNTVTDTKGNVYHNGVLTLGSATFGNITIQAPGQDTFVFFVTKRTPDGKWLWVREVRALSLNILPFYCPSDLLIDESDNIYTTVPFGSDGYKIGDIITTVGGVENTLILKYDLDGNLVWNKELYITGNICSPLKLATDSHTFLYISLLAKGTINVNGGGSTTTAYDISLLRFALLDGSGLFKVGSFGPRVDVIISAVGAQLDADTQGNLYVAGTFKTNTLSWEETDGTLSTPITGALNTENNGFIIKVHYAGYLNWVKSIKALDSNTSTMIGGIALDNKGGLAVAFGSYASGSYSKIQVGNTKLKGMFILGVVKLTTGGEWTWSVKGLSDAIILPTKLSADTYGNFYVSIQGPAAVMSNKVTTEAGSSIAKIANGNWIWAKTVPETSDPVYACATAQSLVHYFSYIKDLSNNNVGVSIDIRQDPQKRLKGIAQEDGDTQTETNTYWYNGIVSTKHNNLIPGRDYGIDVSGELSYLTQLNYKREPNIKYIGTSCSTTSMILNK